MLPGMSAWHRHVLGPVHTVYPDATAYDTAERARLRRLSASGKRIGAIAFSEPDAGSDAGSDLAKVSLAAEPA
jgi:alkylation response protein AidB-like acyl-CoA dehydrogenase